MGPSCAASKMAGKDGGLGMLTRCYKNWFLVTCVVRKKLEDMEEYLLHLGQGCGHGI